MKLSICNEMFEGWDWGRTCGLVKELGYDGVEIAPFTFAERAEMITPGQRRDIRSTAESAGLSIVGLHWLLIKPPGMYVTHPDAAIRRQTANYFTQLAQLCADLGGAVMVIGSPKQRNLMPGVDREQAMAYAQEVFTPALDVAGARGVTLAIEPLSPKETDFLQTAAEARQLVERIGHPAFRMILDVKAMSSESTPIPQIIRESARHLAHFHVNDPNLLGPGMGEVDHAPIIEALRAVGYDGWASVEVFDYTPGPETIARRSIEYLRRVGF
jgi:sugar phosphate isomerase/epimerase